MAKQWSVVEAVSPARAKASIQAARIELFAPEYVIRIRHGRRSELVRRPMLYQYLFVRIDPRASDWQVALSPRGWNGIKGVMSVGGIPVPVPDPQIDRVRMMVAPFERIVCEQAPLSLGQVVRVIEGPFVGYSGPIMQADETPFVGVEMEIMGRPMTVPVLREYVAPST